MSVLTRVSATLPPSMFLAPLFECLERKAFVAASAASSLTSPESLITSSPLEFFPTTAPIFCNCAGSLRLMSSNPTSLLYARVSSFSARPLLAALFDSFPPVWKNPLARARASTVGSYFLFVCISYSLLRYPFFPAIDSAINDLRSLPFTPIGSPFKKALFETASSEKSITCFLMSSKFDRVTPSGIKSYISSNWSGSASRYSLMFRSVVSLPTGVAP